MGHHLRGYFFRFLILVFFALCPIWGVTSAKAQETDPNIVVIRSNNIPSYSEALKGFLDGHSSLPNIYEIGKGKDEQIVDEIKKAPPKVILSIGVKATQFSRKHFDLPIVFCMVAQPEKYGFNEGQITGISLKIPVTAQLEAIKTIFPAKKQIGVIYNPKNSQAIIQEGASYCKILGFLLRMIKVDAKEEVLRILRVFPQVDVLWLLDDPTVLHPVAFDELKNQMKRKKIPIIASSVELVRDGALLALSIHYFGIGKQARHMIDLLLTEDKKVAQIPIEAPQELIVTYNRKIAQTILPEDLENNILAFAQRLQFRVQAIEP